MNESLPLDFTGDFSAIPVVDLSADMARRRSEKTWGILSVKRFIKSAS